MAIQSSTMVLSVIPDASYCFEDLKMQVKMPNIDTSWNLEAKSLFKRSKAFKPES